MFDIVVCSGYRYCNRYYSVSRLRFARRGEGERGREGGDCYLFSIVLYRLLSYDMSPSRSVHIYIYIYIELDVVNITRAQERILSMTLNAVRNDHVACARFKPPPPSRTNYTNYQSSTEVRRAHVNNEVLKRLRSERVESLVDLTFQNLRARPYTADVHGFLDQM